jgi:hypothetical protein
MEEEGLRPEIQQCDDVRLVEFPNVGAKLERRGWRDGINEPRGLGVPLYRWRG